MRSFHVILGLINFFLFPYLPNHETTWYIIEADSKIYMEPQQSKIVKTVLKWLKEWFKAESQYELHGRKLSKKKEEGRKAGRQADRHTYHK